jgi:hypothetical protein
MDIKHKYASITGKKINPLGRAIREIYDFFIGKVTFGPPYICHTYGRSKHMIEQRCKQIQKQLQEIENSVQLFEQQILFLI